MAKALRTLYQRLHGLFRREKRDGELESELSSHVELHVEENLRAGMAPEEARRTNEIGLRMALGAKRSNVLWMVMKQPVQLSAEQIAIFARLYPMNARPVQSAAGRLIKESN